jgi:hypothetical protein|tara:strand:+ start:910 stop:1125 length:216 start_codon:yes stop_codon:yes gene_type:complete
MKLAIQRIYFSLLAGEFVVPDLKPLTTSWLQSRRLAAPTALQTFLFIDLKRIYFKTILNPTKETQEADFPN